MTGIPSEVFDRIGSEPTAASTLGAPERWFLNWAGVESPSAPISVNEFTALNYTILYACVTLIAGTIASLPLKVYRRLPGNGGSEEATERPEFDLLQREFNPNTSAMTGREAGVGHLLTWGNSYCQIVKNRKGDVLRLQPLGPDITRPRLNDRRELEYDVRDPLSADVTTLPRDQVLHVPGMTFDALVGLSPIRVVRSAIRTALTQEREAEKYIANGIRPPGAIKFPQGRKFATTEQATEYVERFRRLHSGPDGASRIPVLEDGADWVRLGIDPASAQLLESRKFQAVEICGLYRVPPFMVGLVEKTTAWGTGIEEMTIGFVVYCLLPTLRRIEQEYNRKLFPNDRKLYCEHVLSGLLRGDTLKQAQALKFYMEWGLLTVNEGRRLLGWNPVQGGDVRYFPLNMGRVDADGNDLPSPAAAERMPASTTEATADPLGGAAP